MRWQQELELAKQAAMSAGQLLKHQHLDGSELISNEGRDVKLQADRDAEFIIMEALKKGSSFPILSEEYGEFGEVDTEGMPYWVVDPLDGTVNFSRGIPLCVVSIALWINNEPILGIINDFNHDRIYAGIVDNGAWCNDEPIHVSDISSMNKAILATGFPVNHSFSDHSLIPFVSMIQKFKKVRMLGAAALSLACVASGAVDAYIEQSIMLWDVAAGIAIVKAAGGCVSVECVAGNRWARNVVCASHNHILNESGRG
jgi:myo-inositol-1(or 4)-monophosphatase